jgi:hypothetical protein
MTIIKKCRCFACRHASPPVMRSRNFWTFPTHLNAAVFCPWIKCSCTEPSKPVAQCIRNTTVSVTDDVRLCIWKCRGLLRNSPQEMPSFVSFFRHYSSLRPTVVRYHELHPLTWYILTGKLSVRKQKYCGVYTGWFFFRTIATKNALWIAVQYFVTVRLLRGENSWFMEPKCVCVCVRERERERTVWCMKNSDPWHICCIIF